MNGDLGALLAAMRHGAAALAEVPLTDAQRPIVQNVVRRVMLIADTLGSLPAVPDALLTALPVLGDPFQQHIETVQHYARLLLESPASFGGASLPTPAQPYAEALYLAARTLRDHCASVTQQSQQQRAQARHAHPETFDWHAQMKHDVALLRWMLRDHPVRVEWTPGAEPVMIHARRYHTRELVRHLLLTTARELMAYGQVRLSLLPEAACYALHLHTTGLALSPDDMSVLFERHGRHIYRERLDADAGYLTFLRQPGVGSTMVLHLPRAGAADSA